MILGPLPFGGPNTYPLVKRTLECKKVKENSHTENGEQVPTPMSMKNVRKWSKRHPGSNEHEKREEMSNKMVCRPLAPMSINLGETEKMICRPLAPMSIQ